MNQSDVPSPIDFHVLQHARDWESKAMDRPFRLEMFEKFADCVAESPVTRILELGSGPGFLADYLLNRNPHITLTLLDFSEAMHELANSRLAKHSGRVMFVTRDFREPDWTSAVGQYGCIITNQAVHELRHKRHAAAFHAQVRELLHDGGVYLVCDHYFGEDGMSNDQLYMSVEEHVLSLQKAGFETEVLLQKGSLVFLRAA